MKFAFFKGCKIPHFLPRYEVSTRSVLNSLDVKLIDLDFNCCGNQVRDQDYKSFIYSAIRNIAIAEKQGLTILTPCKCCFGNLMHAQHDLQNDKQLRVEIKSLLAKENLDWSGDRNPKHLLSVLRHDVGLTRLKAKVVTKLKDYRVAAHYGCHALRPENIVQFDNPFAPTIFEELIAVTGAETVQWSRRLECCGSPILEKNRELSIKLMKNKFEDAFYSNARYICTACTYCQIQFESVRYEEALSSDYPEALLYTDLLELSFK